MGETAYKLEEPIANEPCMELIPNFCAEMPCRRPRPGPGVGPCRRPKASGTQNRSEGVRSRRGAHGQPHPPAGVPDAQTRVPAELRCCFTWVNVAAAGTQGAGTRGADGHHSSQRGRPQEGSNPQGHGIQRQSRQPRAGAWAAEPNRPLSLPVCVAFRTLASLSPSFVS